jgi:peptidoglycan/xylan/chitin deacetylase (PgdA/CDA1 family)
MVLVLLVVLGLCSTPAPRASVSAGAEEALAPVSALPTEQPRLVLAGVPAPTSADSVSYQAALGVWDGTTMAGDASDAAHWLAAGLLISRGDYAAARDQLEAVRESAPADSPLGLRAELLLAGTRGGHKLIALSFDDFPFPNGTPQLLQELARAQVRVTFFAIGHKVREYPDLVALALTQGHSIQNHTYHHVRLTDLTPDQVREELNMCSKVIRDFTGVTPRYLRAPHAASNATVDREARRCGLLCVDPVVTNVFDMTATSGTIYSRCLQRAKPGAILAMHDGLPATLDALPRVIAALRNKGYEFVTVDQLLGGQARPGQPQSAAAERQAQVALWAQDAGPTGGVAALLDPWLPVTAEAGSHDPDAAALR